MAMNREQKRMLRKQGNEVDAEGQPVGKRTRPTPAAPPPRTKDERTGAKQFVREVRQELRKVAWPSRPETINYSVIVISTLLFMTALIFVIDWLVARGVLRLYDI